MTTLTDSAVNLSYTQSAVQKPARGKRLSSAGTRNVFGGSGYHWWNLKEHTFSER